MVALARWACFACVCALVPAQSGCSLLATFGDREARGDQGGSDGAGASRGDGGAAPGAGCPGTAGPVMVRAGAYCVDSTEVTNLDYEGFLAAAVAPSQQVARCAWNESFEPEGFSADGARAALPVVNVDWCDAAAFCAWAGKRLCGKIGGGSVDVKSADSASSSQWYAACSRGGDRSYPYGDAYDSRACQGVGASSAAPAGSLSACEGGFSGVLDMSGNVAEWEDACVPSSSGDGDGGSGASDSCLVRGGSFGAKESDALSCDGNGELDGAHRDHRSLDVGFRCCGP